MPTWRALLPTLLLVASLAATPAHAAPTHAAPPADRVERHVAPGSPVDPVPADVGASRPLQSLLALMASKGLTGAATEAARNLTRPGTDLELERLGDIDGDGADDLLAVQTSMHPDRVKGGPIGHVAAVSGRDLSHVFWSHDLAAGESEGAIRDVDGDGIADTLFLRAGTPSGSATSVPAQVGGAFTESTTDRFHEEFRSGRTGAMLAQHEASFAVSYTDAYAFALLAFGEAFRLGEASDQMLALGHGEYPVERADVNSTNALAFAALDFAWLGSDQVHLSLAGSAARAAATGPLDNVLAADSGTFDTKPGTDHVVLAASDPAPLWGLPAGHQSAATYRVEAWGADGTTLWTQAFQVDPAAARDALVVQVGDLDGDGLDEAAFLRATTSPAGAPDETVTFLSGKDGHALGTADLGAAQAIVLPLGDLDHDGKAELLLATYDAASRKVTLGPADLELKPRWTMQLDEHTILVPSGTPSGFADWTGDGAPDFALTTQDSLFWTTVTYSSQGGQTIDHTAAVNLTFQVRDGVTGTPAWSLAKPGVVAWNLLEGVTGSGRADLAYAQAADARAAEAFRLGNTTVTLHVVAGETGRDAFSYGARTPHSTPAAFSRYDAVDLGNLDGKPGAEVGVRVEEGTPFPNGAKLTADNQGDAFGGWDGDPAVRWLVLHAAGESAAHVVEASGNATLSDQVVVQAKESATKAPGLGLLAVVALLGAAAVVARAARRT